MKREDFKWIEEIEDVGIRSYYTKEIEDLAKELLLADYEYGTVDECFQEANKFYRNVKLLLDVRLKRKNV